ncbi:MAG: MBL fold metallo-hydrolase [Polyangiaceae bacterium]|nr:MBL fold metallo-hydrolase [Polyangiaceae bacterium]MCB9605625.1 MBL fold metallo-hydrolase [Polyangiaceae bacterium]
MQRSSMVREGRFHNALPMRDDMWLATKKWLAGAENREPNVALPIEQRTRADYAAHPGSGLRVSWFGHSSMLIEIDGKRVLTDPVWGRASPSNLFGPKRFFAPPIALEELPELDAIVLSHDHYDHLDAETVVALARLSRAPFIVPLGVGAHLEYWGIEAERIRELEWWQETIVDDLRLVCTPARHFSGRGFLDRNTTLWGSFCLIGREHRAFFSGDTGMFPGFAEIGERLGPFDVTLIESGAYDAAWADVHIGPEQAVLAHQLLRGKVLMPVHWGTFNLALHPWTEPAERIVAASRSAGIQSVIPRPGGRFEPASVPRFERWWPELPWRSADAAPVRSSGIEEWLAELGVESVSTSVRAPSPELGIDPAR